MTLEFDWKRFWHPRGQTFNLWDDGFLADPDGPWGKSLNPGLVSSEDIPECDCVVLFGEPGIGKTWELNRQFQRIRSEAEARNDRVVWLDLRSYGDEGRLYSQLFGSEDFDLWRRGSHRLHVFLDSLDEALIRMSNVGALLADELPKWPVERLSLSIASRPAPWPEILERGLPKIFPGFQAYELAPLRRKDVQDAVQASGIPDVDDFLHQVQLSGATSLAVKPVTLKFLISTFLEEGTFPTNPIALYEKGCRILCEEKNESRRSGATGGLLNANQRLSIAARIAATTQFSNRDAIYLGTESDGIPPEDIPIHDLTGRTERDDNFGEFSVSAAEISEVLNTGLFTSRGPNRLGWAHQTYAEFLAALYCKRHQIPIEQTRSLLFHPAGGSKRLVPQLREIAAWMSAMFPELLEDIAKAEPEALLGASAAGLSDSQRRIIVQSFLDLAVDGHALHLRWEMFPLYQKLKHASLANQLRPYLVEKTQPLGVRVLSADIARAVKESELAADLANIALDATENQTLRNTCAGTVVEIGDSEVRYRLFPLAFGLAGEDPEDELKGSALKAVWPDHITITDILPLITSPKQANLHGAYTSFLDLHFLQRATADQIPALLDWLSHQHYHPAAWALKRLMDATVKLAWPYLDRPDIAAALASVVISRMRSHDSFLDGADHDFAKQVENDAKGRRKLLTEVLPQLDEKLRGDALIWQHHLLLPSDLEWLIGRVQSTTSPNSERAEARLVPYLCGRRNASDIYRLHAQLHSTEELRQECGVLFGPVMLDSQEVTWLREDRTRQQPILLDPPPSERIEERLRMIEAGSTAEWTLLVFDLTLEPNSRQTSEPGQDLTLLPGWKCADANTRGRIVAAALRYVNEYDPQNEKWVMTNSTPYTAIAGFHALALLLTFAEEKLGTITPTAWTKWTPGILRYRHSGSDESNLRSQLLKGAYSLDPLEVLKWIEAVIDSDNEISGYFFLDQKLVGSCWDDRMGERFLAKAADPKLKPYAMAGVLEMAARHGALGWCSVAESFLSPLAAASETQIQKAEAAIRVLIGNSSDASWPKIWPILRANNDLGRQVLESLSWGVSSNTDFLKKLTESQLGELYIWMVQNYPGFEHTHVSGAVGPGHTAAMLRDSVLDHLWRRGTFDACSALRNIMQTFPDYQWLDYYLEQAELAARAATWQPISPRQFMKMVFDADTRFVETSEQLVEVILASLKRLQLSLHDELPAAKFLWNESKGTFQPKDEQDLSDYVAKHLDHDLRSRGIIVNREVQIRHKSGDGSGQRTDIHVDATVPATAPGSFDRAYVIIEVKGNWNRGLLTGMETQLRDRYLKDNRCKNGIYLVGWYSCQKWSVADYRIKQCPAMSLDEARKFFSVQAEELASSGFLIGSFVLDVRLDKTES